MNTYKSMTRKQKNSLSFGGDETQTIQAINLIEDEQERQTVARIIWWDVFAERSFSERAVGFDSLIKFDTRENHSPVKESRLASLLKRFGYDERAAIIRARAQSENLASAAD